MERLRLKIFINGYYISRIMVAVVNKDECVGCGVCVDACPNEAIKMVDDIAVIEADLCIDCEACVSECPNTAISMQ